MDPGVLGGALCCADHRRRPSDPREVLVYLAAWRDSWQLIGEVQTTRLGQSTAGSVPSFTMASRLAVSGCLNAGLD